MAKSRKPRKPDEESQPPLPDEITENVEFAAPAAPIPELGEFDLVLDSLELPAEESLDESPDAKTSHLREHYFGAGDDDKTDTPEERLLHAIFGRTADEETSEAPLRIRKPAMKKSAKQIVAESMPQMQVVEPSRHLADAGPVSPPDAVSPELSALRRKYFGDEEEDTAIDTPIILAAQGLAPDSGIDTGIVLVKPKDGSADPARPSTKAVVVADGRIIGRQG